MKDEHEEQHKGTDSSSGQNEDMEEEEEILFDEEGGEEPIQSRVKRLREKLKRSEKEREENLTGWQRAKADFVNLKRREAEGRKEAREAALEEAVSRIVPLLDSFEGAFASESWEKGDESFKQGIESIYNQFISTLKELGVEQVGTEGEPFDPRIHTSVSSTETDDESKEDVVAEVLQRGYRYHDRILRSPKVVVYHYKQ